MLQDVMHALLQKYFKKQEIQEKILIKRQVTCSRTAGEQRTRERAARSCDCNRWLPLL